MWHMVFAQLLLPVTKGTLVNQDASKQHSLHFKRKSVFLQVKSGVKLTESTQNQKY